MTPGDLLIIGAWQTADVLLFLGGAWLLLRKAGDGVVTLHVRKPVPPRTRTEEAKP